MKSNLPQAALAGLIAFVVSLIVLLILAAIFNAISLPEVASIINRFAWLISLLVGIVTALNRYNGSSLR